MKSDQKPATGISNRETPAEEAAEREEFPPLQPETEGATGRTTKVPGAFGNNAPAPEDQAGSSHPGHAGKPDREGRRRALAFSRAPTYLG